MRASSPLAGVQEEEWGRPHSPEGTDLWELASLDYPGREDGEMQYEVYDDEPRLREWLWMLIPLSYLLSLGFGIPAATITPSSSSGEGPKAPGCYVEVEPSKNFQYSSIQSDPGVNLVLSSVILTYLVPMAVMFLLSLLLCTTRWTKDGKLNRFYKMCIALCIFFMVFKSPIDIIQFRDLMYALEGGRRINPLPNEIEQEVLLVWCALLPVVGNPIIYLTCVSDYRDNIAKAWRICRGQQEKGDEYLEGGLPAIQEEPRQYPPPLNKETQESDVL